MHIYQDIDPVFLSTALRALITQPDEDRADNTRLSLARWFPFVVAGGVEWEWTDKASLRTFTEAMPARAFDTEARIKGREGWQKKSGAMPPFAESYVVSELDMLEIAAAARSDADVQSALSEIFDDLSRGFRAFVARMEIIYAELIRLGTITINENGVNPEPIDFGRSASNTSTAAVAWSVSATADPFGEEEAALDVLKDEQDLDPEDLVVLTHRSTYREWAATDAVRNSLQTVRVHDRISDTDLASIRRDHGLPPIVQYNRSARSYGSGSATQLMPDGDWIYVPANSPLGTTQFGTPVAAQLPNLATVGAAGDGPLAYVEYENNPPMATTTVDFLGLPVLYDPDATYRLVV